MENSSSTDVLAGFEKFAYLSLGRLALEKRFIHYHQLWEALLMQHYLREERLGKILADFAYIDDKRLQQLLQEQQQFTDSKPQDWPMIPDVVLKGLIFLNNRELSQVTIDDIQQAQQILQNDKSSQPKSLGEILVHELKTITQQQLDNLRHAIRISCCSCSSCKRSYRLFNYISEEEIYCPVCWDTVLVEENVAKADTEHKKAAITPQQPDYRASSELLHFYTSLQADNPQPKSLRASSIKKTMACPQMPPSSPKTAKTTKFAIPKQEKPISPVEAKPKEETLSEFYARLEQQIPDKPVAAKSKILRSAKVQDEKLMKLLRRFAIAGMVLLSTIVIIISYAFVATTPPASANIPAKALQVQSAKPNSPTMHKTMLNNTRHPFIKNIQRYFASNTLKPSQKRINAVLKKLHFQGKQYLQTSIAAHIHNITGRLYYYKLYLDKSEQFFDHKWRRIWRMEARANLQRAAQLYRHQDSVYALVLPIAAWMPERSWYGGRSAISYRSAAMAVEDVEIVLRKLEVLNY